MRVRLASSLTSALAALALAAGTLAGVGAPASAADPSPPDATTPGAGWFLTLVSQGHRTSYGVDADRQSLELVSPTGARRVLFSSAFGKRNNGYLSLLDWSVDGRTALLTRQSPIRSGQRVVAVDVATGSTRVLDVPARYSANLLSPDGNGVVVTRYRRKGATVARLGWDRTITPFGNALAPLIATGPTTVAGQAPGRRSSGLDVMSLTTGGVVAGYDTPGSYCYPVRAWDATRTEVSCASRRQQQTLRLVDTATGAAQPLTAQHPRSKKFLGDLDARSVGGVLYVQASTRCGVQIARQGADGALSKVTVGSSSASVALVGTSGTDLVVQRLSDCRGRVPSPALVRFDPVTGAEQPIVALPRTQSFDRVLPFGEVQASLY